MVCFYGHDCPETLEISSYFPVHFIGTVQWFRGNPTPQSVILRCVNGQNGFTIHISPDKLAAFGEAVRRLEEYLAELREQAISEPQRHYIKTICVEAPGST